MLNKFFLQVVHVVYDVLLSPMGDVPCCLCQAREAACCRHHTVHCRPSSQTQLTHGVMVVEVSSHVTRHTESLGSPQYNVKCSVHAHTNLTAVLEVDILFCSSCHEEAICLRSRIVLFILYVNCLYQLVSKVSRLGVRRRIKVIIPVDSTEDMIWRVSVMDSRGGAVYTGTPQPATHHTTLCHTADPPHPLCGECVRSVR